MIGHGTTLRRSDDDGINWREIGQIISLSPPSLSRGTVETTDMESEYKQFVASRTLYAGEISLEVNFFEPDITLGNENDSNQHLLFSDFESGEVVLYRVEFPDERLNSSGQLAYRTAWEFPCIVTSFSVSTPDTDRVTASISLKVAGKPAFVEIAD